MVDYHTWGPSQGRNTDIHPFVGPAKGVKKSEAPHTNKDSSILSVLLLFFTEIFHLLVEQTNVYYQQHLDRQARPSRRLPDITLPDMMTSGRDLDSYTIRFMARP